MHRESLGDVAFGAGRWPMDPRLPTVVFLHGSGGSSVLWEAQTRSLASVANTLSLDLPGHGASGGSGMTRVEDYANAVHRFLEALGAPRPVPCGLSLGGAVVLQLLLDDRTGLFPAGILANTGARLRVAPLILEAIDQDYPGFVASMYTMGASGNTDPSRIRPLADAMAACPPGVTRGDFLACNGFDVMARLDAIRVPVLVLTASEDRLTPGKYGQFLAGRIPGAELANIEGAGHLSPVEKPEEVTRAIRTFLQDRLS